MSSTQSVLGSIVSLWRYPVKSIMGEELNAAEITKGGLPGDPPTRSLTPPMEKLQPPRTRGSGRSCSTFEPHWLTPQEPV
jgi:hypothetical protein